LAYFSRNLILKLNRLASQRFVKEWVSLLFFPKIFGTQPSNVVHVFLFLSFLTGTPFLGSKTLFLFVFFLATGTMCGLIAGVPIGFGDWVGAGIALELGYLGGAFLRSVLGRLTATG
jgi:hypothetical protein